MKIADQRRTSQSGIPVDAANFRMPSEREIHRHVHEAFVLLDSPAKETLIWYLSKQGVALGSDEFDAKKFQNALRDILGLGAEILIRQVTSSD